MSGSLLATVEKGFATFHDPVLVRELMEAYAEAKRNFYLGGLRLSAVEGGRFCEAAFRVLEERMKGKAKFTPLNKKLDVEKLRRELENAPVVALDESIRLHIPRALRVVYDIRNNRDTAHLADGIDPNLQDATLVVCVLDWVLAELVRLYHTVSADQAYSIVVSLVTRRAPAVQDFGGFLKVLHSRLQASDHARLLLYQRGAGGATLDELQQWSRPEMRRNLRRTLHQLTHKHAHAHVDGESYYITATGVTYVEARKLYQLPE